MVTTVTDTRERSTGAKQQAGFKGGRPRGGNGSRGPQGGGAGQDGRGDNGDDGGASGWSPDRYRIGMMVGIGSILMMFTALASAYIVRAGLPGSTDWHPIELPRVVWASTALIIISSLTITVAQRHLRRGRDEAYALWLWSTFALGLAFLIAQLAAWRQLAARGIYLASNPHSSFFYVLTGLHGLHLAGGMLGLGFLLWRARAARANLAASAKQLTLTDVVVIYWHFMDALWVFLFLLLFLWR